MVNTYSRVFTRGLNTCINTCICMTPNLTRDLDTYGQHSPKGVVAYAHCMSRPRDTQLTHTRFHVTPSESEGSAPDRSLPILVADTATLKVIARVGREGAQVALHLWDCGQGGGVASKKGPFVWGGRGKGVL